MRRLTLLLVLLTVAALSQRPPSPPLPFAAGVAIASAFGRWSVSGLANGSAGSTGSIVLPSGEVDIAGGTQLAPFVAGEQITILDGASTENTTISTSNCTLSSGSCTIGAPFTYAHQNRVSVVSATAGLQEAVRFMASSGGGVVALTYDWTGTTADLTGMLTGSASVLVDDMRGGANDWYGWSGSAYAPSLQIAAAGVTADLFSLTNPTIAGGVLSGTFTGSPAFSGNPVFSGSVSAKSIEQVRYADQWCTTPGSPDQSCLTNAAAGWSGPIVVPPGNYSIASNITISNPLTFESGAILDVATGVQATLTGAINAGNQQIFALSGTGFVLLSNRYVPTVNVRWWGATGNGSTNDTIAVQEALTEADITQPGHGGQYVYFPGGNYLIGNVSLGDPATQSDYGASDQAPAVLGIIGDPLAFGGTTFTAVAGTTGYLLSRHNTSGIVIKDLWINGGGTADCLDAQWVEGAGGGTTAAPANDNTIENIKCLNYSTSAPGVDLDNNADSRIDNIMVDGPSGGVALSLKMSGGNIGARDVQLYHGELLLDAQNTEISNAWINNGVEITGQNFNMIDFHNVQIGTNPSTGIVINSTDTGHEGVTLHWDGGLIQPVPAGDSVFAGNWASGAFLSGVHIMFADGTGKLFGTITTGNGNWFPRFTLEHSDVPFANVNEAADVSFRCDACTDESSGTEKSAVYDATGMYGGAGWVRALYPQTTPLTLIGTAGQTVPLLALDSSDSGGSQVASIDDAGNAIFSGLVTSGNAGLAVGYGFFCGGGTCNTSTNYLIGGNGSAAYIGAGYSGIHTQAALAIDNGGSIASGQTLTNSGTISGGTVNAATLQQGGVQAALVGSSSAHQFLSSYTGGTPNFTQPSAADLSNGTTGSGSVVLSTSPALTTPSLGVASATSIALGGGPAMTGPVSAGAITIAAATSGSHSFATAYGAAPHCTATPTGTTPPATALSYAVSATTTDVTVTLSASGTANFDFVCSPAVN